MIDGQSASLSWNKASNWGLWTDFCYCQTVAGLNWGVLTRGRVCHLQLLLALASAVILGSKSCGTHDHILLSQIQDFPFHRLLLLAGLQWRYLTLPPHEIRSLNSSESYVNNQRSVGQSVLELGTHLGLTTRFLLLSDSYEFVDVGCSLWHEDRSVIYNCCWPSPAHSFSGLSPVGLVTIFYCLRFETSLFVASYDSQGYGGGIDPASTWGFN
jgi:hypothetical protein